MHGNWGQGRLGIARFRSCFHGLFGAPSHKRRGDVAFVVRTFEPKSHLSVPMIGTDITRQGKNRSVCLCSHGAACERNEKGRTRQQHEGVHQTQRNRFEVVLLLFLGEGVGFGCLLLFHRKKRKPKTEKKSKTVLVVACGGERRGGRGGGTKKREHLVRQILCAETEKSRCVAVRFAQTRRIENGLLVGDRSQEVEGRPVRRERTRPFFGFSFFVFFLLHSFFLFPFSFFLLPSSFVLSFSPSLLSERTSAFS